MTWHLKDKDLERKLNELSNGEFSRNLGNRTDGCFVSHFGGWVSFTESCMQGPLLKEFPRFSAFFTEDEVEDVPEYNPHDWNEHPKVKPPYRVKMEVKIGKDGASFAGYFSSDGAEDYWCFNDGRAIPSWCYRSKIYFRPWEDEHAV